MIYDYIIVGGGISGLYAMYKLSKKSKNKILLIEKHSKCGGRVGITKFENESVTTGAGVGRQKDYLLRNLLKDLNINMTSFTLELNTPIKNTNKELLKILNDNKPYLLETFQEYSLRILGKSNFNKFVLNSGYTDYLNANAIETLKNYGFNDTLEGFKGFYVPWGELLDKLTLVNNNCEIIHDTVKSITSINNNYSINNKWVGKKILFAIPPIDLKKILPSIYEPNIVGQSFIRCYIKTEKPIFISNAVYNCKEPIQKLIQINTNVYMIYADNESAKIIYKSDRKMIEKYLEESFPKIGKIKIKKIKKIYWKVGTHYYRNYFETESYRNPMTNIYLIGEAYSHKQGWVEGALESVETLLKSNNLI
jgi:hypothetical protein